MFWYVSGYSLSRGMKKHEDIIRRRKWQTFKMGAKIGIGTDRESGYIVISGEIRCDVSVKTNQSLGLISLQAGECFGNLSVPPNADIALTAVRETSVIEPTFEELMVMAKASEAPELTFYKGIFRKKMSISISSGTVVFKPPKVRVEEALRILAAKIGEHRKNHILIKIRPASERLARMAGLGRLHTILTIAELYSEHKVIPGERSLLLPL